MSVVSGVYSVVFVNDGVKIEKVSMERDIFIRIISGSGEEMCLLTEHGTYYRIFCDVWEDDHSFSVEILKENKFPDGRLKNLEVIEKNDHLTKMPLDGSVSLLIEYSNSQLGDVIAWTPYVKEFIDSKGFLFSEIVVRMKLYDFWVDVFSDYNPKVIQNSSTQEPLTIFLNDGKVVLEDLSVDRDYIFYDCVQRIGMIENKDFIYPMGINISNQLRLKPCSDRRIYLDRIYYKPDVNDPYVCIAPCASQLSKMWVNHLGENKWQEVVDYLVSEKYLVKWISKEECNLEGVIDLSGDRPIKERIDELLGCSFFIGLGSGLSWLANACGVHVFRINTWSYGWTEFQENTTIIEYNNGICRGCFNDVSLPKNEFHYEYCPRNYDFQCSKFISADMVIDGIKDWKTNGNQIHSKKRN